MKTAKSKDISKFLDDRFSASQLAFPEQGTKQPRVFAMRLKNAIKALLRAPTAAAIGQLVTKLNACEHRLFLQEKEARRLCYRYWESLSQFHLLLVLDLNVIVLTSLGSEATETQSYTPRPRSRIRNFSLFTPEYIAVNARQHSMQHLIASQLQELVELQTLAKLRSQIVEISERLNELGFDLKEVRSAEPGIDFRDTHNRLHVGICSIATVDITLVSN